MPLRSGGVAALQARRPSRAGRRGPHATAACGRWEALGPRGGEPCPVLTESRDTSHVAGNPEDREGPGRVGCRGQGLRSGPPPTPARLPVGSARPPVGWQQVGEVLRVTPTCENQGQERPGRPLTNEETFPGSPLRWPLASHVPFPEGPFGGLSRAYCGSLRSLCASVSREGLLDRERGASRPSPGSWEPQSGGLSSGDLLPPSSSGPLRILSAGACGSGQLAALCEYRGWRGVSVSAVPWAHSRQNAFVPSNPSTLESLALPKPPPASALGGPSRVHPPATPLACCASLP